MNVCVEISNEYNDIVVNAKNVFTTIIELGSDFFKILEPVIIKEVTL